ncbi:MAG TPA: glycosyltransferase family A protein, partial [Candidatus Saccharimonadales bacterium]|nr:glycosyltransferase family A protein [Candidatus Saccharimonadales bacterium]
MYQRAIPYMPPIATSTVSMTMSTRRCHQRRGHHRMAGIGRLASLLRDGALCLLMWFSASRCYNGSSEMSVSVKALTISLVIPVYNEEDHLDACLRSVMAQRIPFDEIVVVDNNSTDKTLWIARTFPNVRIVRETRQGVVHARSTGFDHARGDIIARIDAD